MTTAYQDRARHVTLKAPITFPATVVVEASFYPNACLGGPLKRGCIIGVVGQEGYSIHADYYTGWIEPNDIAPFSGLELKIPRDVGIGSGFIRDGVLTLERICPSINDIEQFLSMVCYALPQVLSVPFIDPPVLRSVRGRVNDVGFVATVGKMTTAAESTTFELHQERFSEAWGWALVATRPENRRIQRALDYFTQAVRLRRLGATPWEFLAEVLLNLGKSLEVLFPPSTPLGSRDSIRKGLSALDYTLDEIECKFIPVLALRSHVDVAHVSLESFDRAELMVIQRFADEVEAPFRELYTKMLRRLSTGSYSLVPYQDDAPGSAATTTINRLRALQGDPTNRNGA